MRQRLDAEKARKAQKMAETPRVAQGSRYEKVFSEYERLRAALVEDTFQAVGGIADALAAEVKALLSDAAESNKPFLETLGASIPSLKATKEEDLRLAFGKVSEPIVRLYKATGGTFSDYYYCPMAKGYAYWLQPKGMPTSNPYMGTKMASCGMKEDLK